MNIRSFAATIRTHIVAAALATGGAVLAGGLPAHAAWESAHGNSANTGFAMVDTEPAWVWWSQMQPLGVIAPGANPVVAPSGDVYIGNLQGELRAFHADGTPYWTRQLNDFHGGIFAAPVIGADGSIYVVSTIYYPDPNARNESYLHKFDPGGGWIFARPFPKSSLYPFTDGGATTAPPNIWRSNGWPVGTDGIEAIMVPVVYKALGRKELRLMAFSTSGAVLGDERVSVEVYEITGNSNWYQACLDTFYTPALPFTAPACVIIAAITGDLFGFDGVDFPIAGAGIPLPGVAIRPSPNDGPLVVMLTDGRHEKVAYTFNPLTGFFPVARSEHLARRFTTSPVALPNGDTLTGTLDGTLTRTGQNFAERVPIFGLGTLTAAPTRLSDGRLVIVSREGLMTAGLMRWQREVPSPIELNGNSIASAAASCNHIFVATTNEFATFDAQSLTQVASVPWVGGGLHSPVIGPEGHVYAIASDTLYVFPPPWRPIGDTRPPSCALLPPVLSQ